MADTVRFYLDPAHPPRLTPEQEAYHDALTEAEIEAGALADPDNPPLTDEEVERYLASPAGLLRAARRRTGLSQTAFAARYAIPPRTLQEWEQGRSAPEGAALAYLRAIAGDPEAVAAALAGAA